MTTNDDNGIKLDAEMPDRSLFIEGGRVGILLIHGLGGTPVELRFIAQALGRAGHTVYCCQLAGHCSTPEELRRSTWREWLASVEAAHDKLAQQCDVILTGGLSMGGILALHLAQKRPQGVHGLLLFAPTLKLDGWSMPWHSRLLQYVRPTPIPLEIDLPEHEPYGLKDERVRRLVVSSMQSGDAGAAGVFSTPVRSFANFNALVASVKPDLGKVRQPALIVHPREDDIASLRNAQFLQANLGGLVDTLVLDNSYHMVTLDQQRHIVAERAASFVAWVDGQVAAARRRVVPAARGAAVE
ncbi:MAG TPA: alpha/beta fold hydrolase [Hyphomicrobiaceae bacterium]|nr:alpha/beta fold hydrolase [Hyphomicrobiaceae bacterium]